MGALLRAPLDGGDHLAELRQDPQRVGVGEDEEVRAQVGERAEEHDAVGDAGGVVADHHRRAVARDVLEAGDLDVMGDEFVERFQDGGAGQRLQRLADLDGAFVLQETMQHRSGETDDRTPAPQPGGSLLDQLVDDLTHGAPPYRLTLTAA